MTIITMKTFPSISDGTFGVMFYSDKTGQLVPFCLTLERKWLNNEKGKSCIPRGEYTCKRVTSPRFGDTFEVIAVPGRSEILFHKGNIDDDSHGCILIGESFEAIYDKAWNGFSPGVGASGKGLTEFLHRLQGEQEFKLVLESC